MYIVINSHKPGFETFVNGKALMYHNERLTRLAQTLGVTPPIDFYSPDLEEVEAFELEEELAQAQWFDPEAGLQTIQALLQLGATTNALDRELIAELREFEQVLLEAQVRGLKWHFAIDY